MWLAKSLGEGLLTSSKRQVSRIRTHRIIVSGKRSTGRRRSHRPLSPSAMSTVLPVVDVWVDGVKIKALVDSGCSCCIIYAPWCATWTSKCVAVRTMSGQEQKCKGVGNVQLQSGEIGPVNVDVFVADIQPLGFDFILGMTGIQALGGVQITPTRTVLFGSTQKHTCSAAAAMSIDEKDFDASYDHKRKKWTVAWKWSGNDQPDPLKNKIAEYAIPIHVKREYDMEITNWNGMDGCKPTMRSAMVR
ncbi:Uncharacterised protein r2_g2229 [Pycnogonum litorale]